MPPAFLQVAIPVLYVYDAATGEELAFYDFASGSDTVVNDVTLTKTAAWFTELKVVVG